MGAVFFAAAKEQNTPLIDILNSLVPFISSAGAVAAILAIVQSSNTSMQLRSYEQTKHEVEELRAHIATIENCLLKNGKPKNLRIEWIQAAKLILRISTLKASIEDSSNKHSFPELVSTSNRLIDELSTYLYKTLCVTDGNLSGPLPEQFFYGVDNYENRPLKEVKAEAVRVQTVTYSGDEVAPPNGITRLDERSVFIVAKLIDGKCTYGSYEQVKVETINDFGTFEGFSKYIESNI